MGAEFSFRGSDLPRRLQAVAARMSEFPSDLATNPPAKAIQAYQLELVQTRRPPISSAGWVHGSIWPKHAPVRRRTDGTIVWPWGAPAAASAKVRAHVRGGRPVRAHERRYSRRAPVKAKLKSSGVGSGAGSRYKASDRQLGDRAGGLWSDWISAPPALLDANKTARLTTPFEYGPRQFERRNPASQEQMDRAASVLERELEAFFTAALDEEGL